MIVVLGASGHIGDALVRQLLKRSQDVLALVHDASKSHGLVELGAQVAVVDVKNVEELRSTFGKAQRAFLLNPPASTSTDTDADERRSAAAILAATEGTALDKVVLESTYGAQPGEHIGDLGVLSEFEEALRKNRAPASVLRAAYYMTNWDQMLAAATEGKLPTMFPADFSLPMVAPADIASVAADLLISPPKPFAIHHVEGPEHYTPRDVANAFSAALNRDVELEVIPREQWHETYLGLGFSPEAANSYSAMTARTIDFGPEKPSTPHKGRTSLQHYVKDLVAHA